MTAEDVAVYAILLAVMLFATLSSPTPHWKHKWEYRNPFTRTCQRCGRQEDWICWADYAHRPKGHGFMTDRGWWEEMRPGSGEHTCQKGHSK